MSGMVLTCEKLIGNGKKNCTKVLTMIRSAIEATEGGDFLGEWEESNLEEQGEEDEKDEEEGEDSGRD